MDRGISRWAMALSTAWVTRFGLPRPRFEPGVTPDSESLSFANVPQEQKSFWVGSSSKHASTSARFWLATADLEYRILCPPAARYRDRVALDPAWTGCWIMSS